jgi:hypothetical protein
MKTTELKRKQATKTPLKALIKEISGAFRERTFLINHPLKHLGSGSRLECKCYSQPGSFCLNPDLSALSR